MNPVRDQGDCGSCYAFAAVAVIEGRYAIKKGSKVQLSEQQIVDCSPEDFGCDGGLPSKSMNYIKSAGGSMSRASYPYTASAGTCKFNSASVLAKVSSVISYADIFVGLSSGPLPIAVQSTTAMVAYQDGIFDSPCG